MSLVDQQWCPTSVQVTVLQARGLRSKGKSGTNDAYALMQVGKEKYQTSVVEKSVAPVWKEEAAFDLPAGGGGGGCTLHVHVLHRALVGPDKLLGQAVINLLQLSEDKTRNKTEWFKLLDKTGKPDKDRGEVLVDIQFMRNNMTASMFDLSGAGKSKSRLGKFKDKVRGKKKESDAASTVLPSFTQVLTDSEEEEGGGEAASGKDGKKKKHKMKSLFSPKSNLQKNMSQSMSVLPGKNSSLTGSQSSGLNVDSSEGKKKFKFMIHKRSGSSDSKDSSQKHVAAEQSNLCINGSHVYCEEPPPRTSRIGSNFSLASSGHGSMEDVPESSPPSVDSLRAVRQYSPWTEEEEEEVENLKEDVGDLRSGEEERIRVEEEMRRKEEEEERVRREEEEHERLVEEKRRREEEERRRAEEERVRKEEEEERAQEERKRAEEEKVQREEEERIRMEEERKRKEEEEERDRRQEEELKRLAEEKRRREEVERVKKEEEERIWRVEEERRRKEEEERVRRENEELERLAEENRRREEEEIFKREEEERIWRVEEERRRKEKEERVKREQEQECERLAEEKRRLEEEERRRIEEEEKRQREEEERIRLKEEMAQAERRRQEEEESARRLEEEHNLEEEKRRLEEERRIEEEKVRKEEKERAEEERRRREEEEMVKRQEEEKRKLEEEERTRREEEEWIQKEEERKQEEEEKAKREREEYERLAEEKRKLEEQERKRIEAEERIRREEEQRIMMEEMRRKEEEDERIRMEEERRRKEEEEERVRMEEERRRKEEEREKLAEEKRKLEEQERRRFEEEEQKRQREEEERIRKEVERRQEEEERARKEKEEMERLAEEKRRLEEQERKRTEEEEKKRREQKAEKERKEEEARKLEKEKKDNQTKPKSARMKSKMTMEIPAGDTTNPFDENYSNPFEENSPAGPDSSTDRCRSVVSSLGSKPVSTDEKDLISSQRERRPAPQPPGRNQAERPNQSQREQDGSTRHLAQINKQSKDKDAKTASVLPQRSVQMIAPLSRSPADAKNTQMQSTTTKGAATAKHSKRPAPSRPRSVEEGPSTASSSDGNTSHERASNAKQEPVYGLNPFEDDEDELTDDTTSGNTALTQFPPAAPQTADRDAASQTKIKSSKAPAPPLPTKKDATSNTLMSQNTEGGLVTDDTLPDNGETHARDPESEATSPVHVQESPLQEAQTATVQSAGEEAGGKKKEEPPTAPRRLQPVKPLNPLEQQSVSVAQGEKDKKSTGIICEVQEKTKVNDTCLKGPYSQLTREELISLVLKQENQLSERDKKISELEQYIDNLLVRVMEEQPSILMSLNSLKKAA